MYILFMNLVAIGNIDVSNKKHVYMEICVIYPLPPPHIFSDVFTILKS